MADQKPTISLAQWCAYLPYGITVQVEDANYKLVSDNYYGASLSDAIRHNAKPLLRRPHFDIQKIVDEVYNSKVNWSLSITYDYHSNTFYFDDDAKKIPVEHLPNSIMQALLAAHYDIFNLIPQGLALPVE